MQHNCSNVMLWVKHLLSWLMLHLRDGMEFAFQAHQAMKASQHDGEPNTFKQAMQSPEPERSQWYKAASDEIQSLVDNGTYLCTHS